MSPVIRRVTLGAAFVLAAARLACGQTTGTIEGRVSDSSGGVLVDVHVSAASARLQGTRTATSDGGGLFRIPAVPPGDYVVRAALPGFRETGKIVTVRLDGTAQADFVLEPLRTEDILVSGTTPAIDPTSTTTGTSYSSPVITRLPVSRNYADIVRSNPGVSADRGDTQGRGLPLAIYGATSVENQWIIDGVNTTNVFKGAQGKAINNEFVQEVEVKTGGYGAEYGGAFGGVVNVVTKSGGNEFHGDGFVYYDSVSMASEKVFLPGDIPVEEMRPVGGWRADYGADLGGFLLKDRLWIFGAFDRVERHQELSRFESTALVSTEDRFPSDTAENLYSGKLTWNVSPSTSVVGTVFADPSAEAGLAGDPPVSLDPSTWYSARARGGTDFGVRFTQLVGANAMAVLQGSYHEDESRLDAPDGIRYEDWTCPGGTPESPCELPPEANSIVGGYGFIGALAERPFSSRYQIRGEVTLYRGSHEIEAGGGYFAGETKGAGYLTGGQMVQIHNEKGQTYYQHLFLATGPDDPTPVSDFHRGAATTDFGFYLQDSWKAAPGLTVNAGLRWDGADIRDYKGDTVLRLRSAWQPRLGVIWDPWKDGRTKVFAFAGRFSWAMPTAMAASAFGDAAGFFTWNLDPVSVVPDPRVIDHEDGEPRPGAFTGPFGAAVDSEVSAPYQDELIVGVERSFGSGLTVGLKGVYRRLGAAIESRCDLEEDTYGTNCAILTPGSSGRFASGDVTTCNGYDGDWYACELPGPATPRARRVYRGLEVLARQSIGERLWLQASYVYSSLRGNYDGGVNQSYSQTTPGFAFDFDYPAMWHNAYGRLYLDRPNRLRVDGYWATPGRLTIGLQLFVESGAPINRLGYFNGNYGTSVYLVPRGAAGRLPTLWDMNATLAYTVPLGPATATLQLYFFNVFNNQIPIAVDETWTNQAPEGYPATIYDPSQPENNGSYGAVLGRSDPRSVRAALRVSF